MKFVFIDTNVVLHCTSIDQIDWLAETRSRECTIVIAPVTIDEVDAKKRGNDKISNRARSFLQKIESIADSDSDLLRTDVRLLLLHDKPLPSVYADFQLNPDEADHRLIATIFKFKELNPGADVTVCAYDTGVRVRAKQHYSLDVLKLSDKYYLAFDDDDAEKKVKRLEKELESFKMKAPLLSLKFVSGEAFVKLKKKQWVGVSKNDFVQKQMEEVEAKFQYMHRAEIPRPSFFGEVTEKQIKDYNEELSQFFDRYRRYLVGCFELDYYRHHSYILEVVVSNEASYVPAEDVDVHMHFPDGFVLLNKEDAPTSGPIEPEPPHRPEHAFDMKVKAISGLPYINARVNIPRPTSFDPYRPSIKRTNSYDVDVHAGTIKHTYTSDISPFVVVFENEDSVKNFTIDYRISASNLPKPTSGELGVVFVD